MRAANNLTVMLAYLSFILRLVQLVGLVLKKEKMSKIAYGFATFFVILMFFTDFAKEAADIIHESMPTEKEQMDIEMFTGNYQNYVPPK